MKEMRHWYPIIFILVLVGMFYFINKRLDMQAQQMQNEVRINRQVTLDSRKIYTDYLDRILVQCNDK